MRLFLINWRRLLLIRLLPGLRNSWVRYMLDCVFAPLVVLHDYFWNNRQANITHIRRNDQVCHLRRMLNEEFPEAEGRIRIEEDLATGQWLYAWDEQGNDAFTNYTLAEDDTLVWDQGAIVEGVSGFIVIIPKAVFSVNNDAKVRALLNTYKLVSKTYTIIYE